MKEQMLTPKDWKCVKEELPRRSGYYYSVANNDIYEISVVTSRNIALYLDDPEQYDEKQFRGINDPRWFLVDSRGYLYDITSVITHWLPKRINREIKVR